MDEWLLDLRRKTYSRFVELGRAPSVAEIAEDCGLSTAQALSGWRALHDQHALVLDASRGSIRMANPVSAVPTSYRVEAAGRSWYANCAWDAFGICAALSTDGTIDTACPDCGVGLTVRVRNQHPDDATLLFHCLVPARNWWDDIVFT